MEMSVGVKYDEKGKTKHQIVYLITFIMTLVSIPLESAQLCFVKQILTRK